MATSSNNHHTSSTNRYRFVNNKHPTELLIFSDSRCLFLTHNVTELRFYWLAMTNSIFCELQHLLSIGRATYTCRHVCTRNFHAYGARKSETAVLPSGGQVELTMGILNCVSYEGSVRKQNLSQGQPVCCIGLWMYKLIACNFRIKR